MKKPLEQTRGRPEALEQMLDLGAFVDVRPDLSIVAHQIGQATIGSASDGRSRAEPASGPCAT